MAQRQADSVETTGFHHPIKKLEDEAHTLIEAEHAGETSATPLISIGMILTVPRSDRSDDDDPRHRCRLAVRLSLGPGPLRERRLRLDGR